MWPFDLTPVDAARKSGKSPIVARGGPRLPSPSPAPQVTGTSKSRPMRAVAIAANSVISVEEHTRRILVLSLFAFLALC